MSIAKFSERKIRAEVMTEAKALGIEAGTATLLAEKAARGVAKWLEGRSMVTEQDITMRLAQELKPYNKDLAYMFKNKGRII